MYVAKKSLPNEEAFKLLG